MNQIVNDICLCFLGFDGLGDSDLGLPGFDEDDESDDPGK